MRPAGPTAQLVELRAARDRLAVGLVAGGKGEALAETLADALELVESIHAAEDSGLRLTRGAWAPWWSTMALRRRRLIRGLEDGLDAVREAVASNAELRAMAAGMAEASASAAACGQAGCAQDVTTGM